MFPDDLIKKISAAGVVAVVTIENANDAIPLARSLLAGGVSAIELTYRSAAAPEAIRRIRAEVPEALVGAGTLLNREQLKSAQAAGAFFGVAPGCNPSTLHAAEEIGLPFAPGVATASEIEIAIEHGCRLLKFFPAETSGGLPHLVTLAAPFAHLGIRYIPLGGISATELPGYLKSSLVASVGGSWLAKPDVIKRQDWKTIETQAAAAMAIVKSARGA